MLIIFKTSMDLKIWIHLFYWGMKCFFVNSKNMLIATILMEEQHRCFNLHLKIKTQNLEIFFETIRKVTERSRVWIYRRICGNYLVEFFNQKNKLYINIRRNSAHMSIKNIFAFLNNFKFQRMCENKNFRYFFGILNI